MQFRGARPCLLFFLSLILLVADDANLQTYCLAGVRRGVVPRALRCKSSTAGCHLVGSCMPCARLHGSPAFSLRGLLASSVVLLATWSPLYVILGLTHVLARPRPRQSFFASTPVLRHCVQYVLSCLIGLRGACFFALPIIILLISGIFRGHRRYSLASAAITWASSSAYLVIALPASPLSEFLSPFTAC